ncbi:MAG: GNAT family N-acetyltransferase, partial [Candidatus Kerfeldbacteria bacterium]|nr:GNAT family N-acetyltransferase [Candidatus Kerfeldbacteria bacterium]
GLKITYHMMQNLPGSAPSSDLNDIKTIFSDAGYQPDHIKIYPCLVVKSAPLYRHWKAGRYHTYPPEVLMELLADIKANVPAYVRIERLVRDIPENSIIAGNTITNLRQIMQLKGVQCVCIRCREPRADLTGVDQAELVTRQYDSADGQEYFISYEDPTHTKIFGFVRLRLQQRAQHWYPELQDCAIIRELHVYGQLVPVTEEGMAVQHRGMGRRMMEEAERVAREAGFKKIAVIAGVGVRRYYEKLGYQLDQEYMVKTLTF